MASFFLDDLRHALRALRHRPGFFLAAVLTLALGVGAVTAIFTVYDAVLLKPLPFREADRIVRVMRNQTPVDYSPISAPMVGEWERGGREVFDAFGVYVPQTVNLTGAGHAQRLEAYAVSPGYWAVFGQPIALGRAFGEAEENANERVVVIGDALWRNRFDADPAVLGRDIHLNGESWRVIGVAEPGFRYPSDAQLWLPTFLPAKTSGRGSNSWAPVARLAPGVDVAQAAAAMKVVTDWQAETFPDIHAGLSPRIERVRDLVGSRLRSPLAILLSASALVLLIACANLAGLMLARGQVRAQELALRRAIGAGSDRLVRQVLAESSLIAFAGTGVALLLAPPAVRGLLAMAPGLLPAYHAPGVDWRVGALACAVALATLLLFGLAPALRASRADPVEAMRGASRGQTGSRAQARARGVLVAAEIALAMTLLVGAGLLIDSLRRLGHVDPGVAEPETLLAAGLSLPTPAMQPGEEFAPWVERVRAELAPRIEALETRVAALPGVRSVAFSDVLPGGGATGWNGGVSVAGHVLPEHALVQFRFVGPEFFRTAGIPLLQGRAFTSGDGPGIFADTALVNRAFVDRYLGGGDALGAQVSTFDGSAKTVVGVVENVRQGGPEREPDAEIYFPMRTAPTGDMALLVRVDGDALALAESLRRAVREVAPDAPVHAIRTMDSVLRETTALRRFNMGLMGVFAGVALALAAVGLYGVIAYAASQRQREIGVRKAVGARGTDIHAMMLRAALRMVLPGIVAGTLGALALGRFIASQLYGVGASDPRVLGLAALALTAVALVACLIPTLRAARVPPMAALRDE